MRHAVVLLLGVSLSGFPATGEMLTPPLGLRSGAVAPAPPAPAVQLPPEMKALTDVEQLLGASAVPPPRARRSSRSRTAAAASFVGARADGRSPER